MMKLSRRRLAEFDGQYFIADKSLSDGHYHNPQVDDIVTLFGDYKEQDIFVELAGRVESPDISGWWVTRVDPDTHFKDLPIQTNRNRGKD